MTTNWIPAVYNRTYSDIEALLRKPDIEYPTGCFNYIDLYRIENNTQYVLEYMLEHKIIYTTPPVLRIKMDWTMNDIPLAEDVTRIIENVQRLCELSNPEIQDKLPILYASTQISYILANDIERALDLMHNQPNLPVQRYELIVTRGDIWQKRDDDTFYKVPRPKVTKGKDKNKDGTPDEEYDNFSIAYIAENEIVKIKYHPDDRNDPEPFLHWTGAAEDLYYLDDETSQETTFEGQARDSAFTAEVTLRPGKLIVNNGYIATDPTNYDVVGPSEGEYEPGTAIIVVADRAIEEHKFYQWEAIIKRYNNNSKKITESSWDFIGGGVGSSTITIAMPEHCEELILTATYINARRHEMIVTNGAGSGSYLYDEVAVVIAKDRSEEWMYFKNWSGDTTYLLDIYSSINYINMPDKDVYLTANYEYIPPMWTIHTVNGNIITQDNKGVSTSVTDATFEARTTIQLEPLETDEQKCIYWEDDLERKYYSNTIAPDQDGLTITGHYANAATFYFTEKVPVIHPERLKSTDDNLFEYWLFLGEEEIFDGGEIQYYRTLFWEELTTHRIISDTSLTLIGSPDIKNKIYKPTKELIDVPINYINLILENINCEGKIESCVVSSDNPLYVSTLWRTDEEIQPIKIFDGWSINGDFLSTEVMSGTSLYIYPDKIEYSVPNGSNQYYELKNIASIRLRACYRNANRYTLTLVDGTFSDETTSKSLFEFEHTVIHPNTSLYPDKIFTQWETEGHTSMDKKERNAIVYLYKGNGKATAIFKSKVILYVYTEGSEFPEEIETWEGNIVEVHSPAYYMSENDKYVFKRWILPDPDHYFCVIKSAFSIDTKIELSRSTNAKVMAEYELEVNDPHRLTIDNGYIQNEERQWVHYLMLKKGEQAIIRCSASTREGYQFLQWEVIQGWVDISCIYAETTRITMHSEESRIQAVYAEYNPNREEVLGIVKKDNSTEFYKVKVGYTQPISAELPDEGYVFYKWNSNIGSGHQYLLEKGLYESNNTVTMPKHTLILTPQYVPNSITVKYHLFMHFAMCSLDSESDPSAFNWVSDIECPQNEVIRIKCNDIPTGWRFHIWRWETDNPDLSIYIDDETSSETTIIMPAGDCHITAVIIEVNKYEVYIVDGGTSGTYVEGARADVYFNKANTKNVQYEFLRWDGTPDLYLYDTWARFDYTIAGSAQFPQYIRVPHGGAYLEAHYRPLYRVYVANGLIVNSDEEYFYNGSDVYIEANPPSIGYTFDRWIGDTSTVDNIYNPTTSVHIASNPIQITASYKIDTKNNIGVTDLTLDEINILLAESINIISGRINVGFILIDAKSHIYTITEINGVALTVVRITAITKGGINE